MKLIKNIGCVVVFLLFVTFTSCNFVTKGHGQLNYADTLLMKTISFPVSLKQLEGGKLNPIDSFLRESANRSKIVSIVDGDCVKCIVNHLNALDSVFNSLIIPNTQQVVFVLNVSRKDSVFFMFHFEPIIKASGVVLWDDSYNFERYNALLTPDRNLRTFMVDKSNRIVQYGNPILNPEVLNEYKKKILESR